MDTDQTKSEGNAEAAGADNCVPDEDVATVLENKIRCSWQRVLSREFSKEYFGRTVEFVNSEYTKHTVYPPRNKIFSAFLLCGFQDVKVSLHVIKQTTVPNP